MQAQTELAVQPAQEYPALPVPLQSEAHWNSWLKIAFRFGFAYLGLYCFPFPLGAIPYTGKPAEWYENGWQKIVPWVAKHILHLAQPITIFSNGSGDTTYDYVKVLCFLTLAVAATIVWSVLDRNRETYSRLHQWLRFYVRLSLGCALLSYGGYKVVPSQFPPIWRFRYLEAYGDSSPMGILWTFMSASKSYTIFAGSVEMLGGILLFVPRLMTLGALIGLGAMTNVFILNMSYDVPVKLYSFHLLLLSVFLLLPEMQRLTRFFVLNRATEPAPAELQFRWPKLNRGLLIAQLALGLFFGGYALYTSNQQLNSFLTGDFVAKPPLRGIWSVDEFMIDGQSRPPLLTDNLRWQKVIFDTNAGMVTQGMDSKLLRFAAKIDSDKKTMELTSLTDTQWKGNLTYTAPSKDVLMMDGQLAGHKVHLQLHALDGKYLLNTRGFHWINELPFNR